MMTMLVTVLVIRIDIFSSLLMCLSSAWEEMRKHVEELESEIQQVPFKPQVILHDNTEQQLTMSPIANHLSYLPDHCLCENGILYGVQYLSECTSVL